MYKIYPAEHAKKVNSEHSLSLVMIEQTQDPVLVLRRFYPAGHRVPLHSHTRMQIWCAREGVVLVSTAAGRWMIPPGHGLIIPAGLEHAAETISKLEMHSVYVGREVLPVKSPKVVEVTALAASLILCLLEEDRRPLMTRRRQIVRELLLDEINCLPERPLGLPFPEEPHLASLCRHFLKAPAARSDIDGWAEALGISRRSFTRLFRAETGVSFATWRQQACIFASLPRLAAGEPITNVALEAGYESMAAFTTMFRRMLGSSPRDYLKASIGKSRRMASTDGAFEEQGSGP